MLCWHVHIKLLFPLYSFLPAPVPFNSKKLAHGCKTKVVRKFNDQSSPTDIYIKGMTIWMRRWREIPVYGGMLRKITYHYICYF